MSNQQLSILYNGKPTAVTCMGNDTYYVQITSKPYVIQKVAENNNAPVWVEVETGRETNLSQSVGHLIGEQL